LLTINTSMAEPRKRAAGGLKLALDQRDRLGCVGVATDAKPDGVAFYERALSTATPVNVLCGRSFERSPRPNAVDMFRAFGHIASPGKAVSWP
jgi:hypothetical protein